MALTKRVPVLLTPEEYKELKILSKRKKKPMGDILRGGFRRTLEEEKKDAKMEAFKALDSLGIELPDWPELEEEIARGKLIK